MAYEIVLNKAIRKQISKLPGHIKAIAKQRIANLSDDPRPSRSKELTGHSNYYRLWLRSKYRLVWHVSDEEQVVEIEYVGPKVPDLYEWLGLGRPSAEANDRPSAEASE
jgi:mRNA-degrading endonuclease RelE of RelBE toxin-antitoxin system